jgi:PBP1b-binding outer membrane lipoprotein LpoB
MSKKLAVISAVVVSCFLMVGCSGSAKQQTATPASSVASDPAPAFDSTPDPVFEPMVESSPEPEPEAESVDEGFGFDDLGGFDE